MRGARSVVPPLDRRRAELGNALWRERATAAPRRLGASIRSRKSTAWSSHLRGGCRCRRRRVRQSVSGISSSGHASCSPSLRRRCSTVPASWLAEGRRYFKGHALAGRPYARQSQQISSRSTSRYVVSRAVVVRGWISSSRSSARVAPAPTRGDARRTDPSGPLAARRSGVGSRRSTRRRLNAASAIMIVSPRAPPRGAPETRLGRLASHRRRRAASAPATWRYRILSSFSLLPEEVAA